MKLSRKGLGVLVGLCFVAGSACTTLVARAYNMGDVEETTPEVAVQDTSLVAIGQRRIEGMREVSRSYVENLRNYGHEGLSNAIAGVEPSEEILISDYE